MVIYGIGYNLLNTSSKYTLLATRQNVSLDDKSERPWIYRLILHGLKEETTKICLISHKLTEFPKNRIIYTEFTIHGSVFPLFEIDKYLDSFVATNTR